MSSTYPIIGMSPGNSYFKDAEVEYLLKEAISRYGYTAILIADVPAIATYMAYGYSENRARNKAIPKGNNLKNRALRIATQLGIADKVRIIDWALEVENTPEYQEQYGRIRSLYEMNQTFKETVDITTRSVLETSEREIPNLVEATKTAVHYLLSELAFLEFAPHLLAADQVVYMYHRNWPVYERYISGAFDGIVRSHLEFLLLENPKETYRSLSSGEQMNRLQTEQVLRCSFNNLPPGFIEDETTGSFSGIFYDLIMQFAASQNWKIEWSEETGYGVIEHGLNEGRFDVFAAATWPTPERLATLLFSMSAYQSEVGLWVREADQEAVKNPATQANTFFRVAIKENDISDSIATSDYPAWRKVRVPQLTDTEELLRFVANGDADATFVEPLLAELFNQKSQIKLVNIADAPVRVFDNCFALAKASGELKALLDTFLQEKRASGEIVKLLEKYAPGYKELGIRI